MLANSDGFLTCSWRLKDREILVEICKNSSHNNMYYFLNSLKLHFIETFQVTFSIR